MESFEWSQPPVTGESPGPCNMHTANYYKGEIFVFRGGNGRDYLNDLHALNIENYKWRKVKANGKYPPERANHCSALVGNKLYTFGGWNGRQRLNDLYMIDLGNSSLALDTETWSTVDPRGEIPSPRSGMSMSNIGDRLLLFGGSGSSSKFFNDIQIYDPLLNEWVTPAELSNKLQPQRAGHNSVLVDRNLYIIGGSCGSNYLSKISVLEIYPPPAVAAGESRERNSFFKGLAEFLNSSEHSDITFLVEGRPFHCHRVVLAAVSEYFRAMFKSGMKESRESSVAITGVSYRLFEEFMRYIYTGELKVAEDSSPEECIRHYIELMRVADQFMIDEIKRQCEVVLLKFITPANAAELEEAAEMYKAGQLKAYIQWYRNTQQEEDKILKKPVIN
eukprot:TRINITY_DN8419_c0_g2_i2.p1 TRINITY_DN8419_c0_g2~~TRINITY_DN8419_c0_g2_i2.p1  ORF type:complete len:391 (-),score=68.69 TRINITY_DN8419_c0_g2_i2:124-1296(-)